MLDSYSYKGAQRLEDMYFSPIRIIGERASALAEQGYPVVSFSSGEPDFDTPFRIKEATIKAIQKNQTHYAPNRGMLVLRQEIAAQLKRVNNLDYDPVREILVTSGGAEAIQNSFLAVLNPGDQVIVFTPAFMNYENLISMCGATIVKVPLKSEQGFQVDVDELEARVNDSTRMIVINNPCNPTGVVIDKATLERIAQIAIRHNLLVFSDEIYNQIIYDNTKCISMASIYGMRDRVITMNGFSKAYAMTGLRLGYFTAPAAFVQAANLLHQNVVLCANITAQYGAIAALKYCENDMLAMVAEYEKRRQIMIDGFKKIGLPLYEPEGAFYVFPCIKQTGLTSMEFVEKLLSEEEVLVIPGSSFGASGEGFIRCSYAYSEDNLREALTRLDRFIRKYTK